MYDKTTFVGANGRRRTYADLVIHGSTENNEDSEDSDEEMTNEGESSDEEESGMMEEMLEWSQAQREAYRRARKEERAIPSITVNRLQNDIFNIQVNKAEKKRLERPWKHTLIIKLLGRSISYGVLKRRLDTMWAKSRGLDLIDLGNDFFVVRLFNEDDYWYVLEGGPWMLFDHYLTIRRWTPDFNPFGVSINKIAAWVRLPDLPIEYYDKRFLGTVGDQIGKTLKVDMNTANQSREKFAKLCMKIDLNKPLDAKYLVNGQNYFIEYEGLHMVCFKCGKFGHVNEGCMQAGPTTSAQTEKENAQVGAQARQEESGRKEVDKGKKVINENPNFGAWMIIQKQKRTRKYAAKESGDSGHKDRGEKNNMEKMANTTRYEVLAQGTDYEQARGDNENGPHQQVPSCNVIPNGVPKEFLNGSQMRKTKASTAGTVVEPIPLAQGNPTQTPKRKMSNQHEGSNSELVSISRANQLKETLAHFSPMPSSNIPNPFQTQPTLSIETVIEETPMNQILNLKPQDPTVPCFSGSDLDEVLAEGTLTVMEWDKRDATPVGEDMNLA
ncbi:hypothetical protein AHAS_Ahas19G0118700 [Arachis hypogaea]